jgi:hypothetical protein
MPVSMVETPEPSMSNESSIWVSAVWRLRVAVRGAGMSLMEIS